MKQGDIIIARSGFKTVLGQVKAINGTRLTITTPTGRTAILDTLKWIIQVLPYVVELFKSGKANVAIPSPPKVSPITAESSGYSVPANMDPSQ